MAAARTLVNGPGSTVMPSAMKAQQPRSAAMPMIRGESERQLLRNEQDKHVHSQSDPESSDTCNETPGRKIKRRRQRTKRVLCCFPQSWVIVPRASRFVERWDLVVSVMTMFTAFWTPFTVAFGREDEEKVTATEALLDLTFGFDIVVQFFTAYQPKNGSALWEKDPDKIAEHYLKGWFAIDFMSIIPVTAIIKTLSLWGGQSNESVPWVMLFVFLRLLKLLRLLRMARVARVVQRWQYDIGIPYAHLALIRCILLVVLACHWIGCLWGGIGQAGRMFKVIGIGDGTTWLTLREEQDSPPSKIYTLCFYWAVVTLTTVGYGDISPQTEVEYMFCTAIIFIGASIWAYVVGGVCAIISNMDPQATIFQQRMDDLNAVMNMSDTPKDIRRKARDYMHESRVLRQRVSGRAIFAELSDALRGQLERHHFDEWLQQVWYLQDLDHRVVASLAMNTREALYAPLEAIGDERERALYFLRRGLVYIYYLERSYGWMVQKGKSWGIDIIVADADPTDRCSKKAVTYSEVCSLSKKDFDKVRIMYPAECASLRKAENVLRVKRAMIRHAKSLKESLQHGTPLLGSAAAALDRQRTLQRQLTGTLSPRASRTPPMRTPPMAPPGALSPQFPPRLPSGEVDGNDVQQQLQQVVQAIQGAEARLQATVSSRCSLIEDRLLRVENRVMRMVRG